MYSKEAQELAKPCYEAIRKISKGKWEWEPKVGEWVVFNNNACLITRAHADLIWWVELDCGRTLEAKKVIPLLHWERIRKILKQFGYSFSITSGASGGEITIYENIGTDKVYEKYHNNDLQLEVMLVVIELGKGEIH